MTRAMLVSDLMTRPAVSCRPDDSLHMAAGLMWNCDCGALPVVDRGKLVGMITDRDICIGAYSNGSPMHTVTVADVMTPGAHACRATDSVARAHAIMRERGVRRLPVLDVDGRVVGMLSINDLARAAAAGTNDDALATVTTLATIGAPRPSPGH